MNSLSEDTLLTAPPAPTRHQMRLDRQARVGILRNLKEPPRLPPRKAALTGKWLDLRSRRRLRRQGIGLPAPEAPIDTLALSLRDTGPEEHVPVVSMAHAADGVLSADAKATSPEAGAEELDRVNGRRFVAGIVLGLALALLCAVAASWFFSPPG